MNYSDLIGVQLGQFKLLEVIGVGGMGAVYRAHQSRLSRDVAVKVLPSELGIEQSYIDRFIREAEIVATLEHSNIIPVYGFDTEDELTYVAMRLLTGGSLMDRLAPRDGREQTLPSIAEASQLLKQIAGALDYAHSKGIIHRDIKPGNIMFDQRGEAFLVDFGIAKLLDATQALTAVGTTMGTPIFMAPEQWRTEDVSSQTDQYAMGALMYFTLAGVPPFQASTAYMLMQLHLDAPVPFIDKKRPDVPSEVSLVLEQAMAKRQNDRYPSMREFADAFERAVLSAGSSEPTQFFRPQGIFADTNKEAQAAIPISRDTVQPRYEPPATTPAGGMRIPEETTARRHPPASAVQTQQGNTPLPVPRKRRPSTAWYKSPITWLLIAFFLIFGTVAFLLTRSDSNNPSETDNEQTQTAKANASTTSDTATPTESVDVTEEATDEAAADLPAMTPGRGTTERAEPSATNTITASLRPTTTLSPSVTAIPSPTPTPEPIAVAAHITGDRINVRAGPNVYFSIVETMQQGQSVELYAIDDEWAYIGFNDRFGWVFVNLLNITGNADDLPDVNDTTAVRCPLPDSVRYNSEWTPIFWLLGCPEDETEIRTTATIREYDGGTVIERHDTNELIIIVENDHWTILPINSNSLGQLVDTDTLQSTTRGTFYIQRYTHGYIFDPNDESETRVLLDSNRLP